MIQRGVSGIIKLVLKKCSTRVLDCDDDIAAPSSKV